MVEVLQVGRVVGDHFRLRKRLGEGGAGRFWEAEDLRAGARVAIEFSRAAVSSPTERMRFEREARAFRSFRSAHVVRVFSHGFTSEGYAFRATEWLCGETLECALTRTPTLGAIETAEIVDQVCRAIARLEIHGLAAPVPTATRVFLVPGADGSCVVKLLLGELGALGSRATVAALGALAHRMLTGAPAWHPDSAGARSDLQPLPAAFDEWFRTALHADVSAQFSSFEQASLAFGHIARAPATRSPGGRPPALPVPCEEEADISGDAVLIEPGVFATRGRVANDSRTRRTRRRVAAFIAIALGVFAGFALRTALSDAHSAARTTAPEGVGVASSDRTDANQGASPPMAADTPAHASALVNTAAPNGSVDDRAGRRGMSPAHRTIASSGADPQVDLDLKSHESPAGNSVHAKWHPPKRPAGAVESDARALDPVRASSALVASPAVAPVTSPPAAVESAPARVYRGF